MNNIKFYKITYTIPKFICDYDNNIIHVDMIEKYINLPKWVYDTVVEHIREDDFCKPIVQRLTDSGDREAYTIIDEEPVNIRHRCTTDDGEDRFTTLLYYMKPKIIKIEK